MTVRFLGIRTCDKCGRDDDSAEGVVLAAGNLPVYDIDLCPRCKRTLDRLIGPYLEAARRRPRAGVSLEESAEAERRLMAANREIRDWGRANGFTVRDSGSISPALRRAYNEAH